MSQGEYSIEIPAGTYTVTASKEGYISQSIENIEVLENQTTVLNFELTKDGSIKPTGGENMKHTVDINIVNCEDETIEVPDGCPAKRYKFISAITGNPHVGKTVELLNTDGHTIIQTVTTDADGFAPLLNAIYGNYIIEITY